MIEQIGHALYYGPVPSLDTLVLAFGGEDGRLLPYPMKPGHFSTSLLIRSFCRMFPSQREAFRVETGVASRSRFHRTKADGDGLCCVQSRHGESYSERGGAAGGNPLHGPSPKQ